MRIIRFIGEDGRTRLGEQRDDFARVLIRIDVEDRITLSSSGETRPIGKILAPIDPPNILCAGRNYPGSGITRDDELELFMKPTTAIAHPDDPVLMPRCDDGIDPQLACEGELAVVIGRLARNINESNAFDYVLGFTLANDVTARRWQTKEGPPRWMRGKGFDTFCPLGPAIVTADEIAELDELEIVTRINGEVHRAGRTNQMIRSVPRLVAEISERITLLPGAVILTGAPGMARGIDDRSLRLGDHVEVSCEGIGTLANVVQ